MKTTTVFVLIKYYVYCFNGTSIALQNPSNDTLYASGHISPLTSSGIRERRKANTVDGKEYFGSSPSTSYFLLSECYCPRNVIVVSYLSRVFVPFLFLVHDHFQAIHKRLTIKAEIEINRRF